MLTVGRGTLGGAALTALLDGAGVRHLVDVRRYPASLIADHLVLVEGVAVAHLTHDGGLTPHVPTDTARRHATDVLYAAPATTPTIPGLSPDP